MTDAQKPVVCRIIGDGKKCRLDAANVSHTLEASGRHGQPIISGDTFADGENCISVRVGSGCLDQLNKRVCVTERIGVDRSHAAITGAGDILQQWSNLKTLRSFSYRNISVGETTKQIVGVPLGCVD